MRTLKSSRLSKIILPAAIDLAANTGHHLGPRNSPRKLRAIRRFSIHRAFQILDLKYRHSSTIEHLLGHLARTTDMAIVSVNWDVVVENHYSEMGLAYKYGQSVKSSQHGIEASTPLPLLKLHGSATWVYCDSCRTLFSGQVEAGKDALHRGVFLDREDFEVFQSSREIIERVRNLVNERRTCTQCGCRMSARVGTFSYRKDFAIQQLARCLRRAKTK